MTFKELVFKTLNLKNKNLLDFNSDNLTKVVLVLSSLLVFQIVTLPLSFLSPNVSVTTDIFLKDIKRERFKNNYSKLANLEKGYKKRKKVENLVNSRSQNTKKKQERDTFLIQSSLFFVDPKIGDQIVVTKNTPSQRLKSGMVGEI